MICKINKYIFKCLNAIIASGVIFLVAMLFLQVVLRYVFDYSIGEIDELSRYMFIWIIFLGISIGYREKAHLGVTALTNRLDAKKRRIINLVVSIITMIFMALLFVAGCEMVKLTMDQRSSTLLIPMGYIYASVPVGAVLCFLTQLERVLSKETL